MKPNNIEEISIETVIEQSRARQNDLKKEIGLLRESFGINEEQEEITTEKDLDSFMTRSFSRLNEAIRDATDLDGRSEEESQKILTNLANQQSRFLVDMKTAQMFRLGFVAESCEKIQNETDLANIPSHTASVRKNLTAIEATPSLDDLEHQVLETKKMLGFHSSITDFARKTDDRNGLMLTTLQTGITQSAAEVAQSFAPTIPGAEDDLAFEAVRESFDQNSLEDVAREVKLVSDKAKMVDQFTRKFEASFIIAEAQVDGKITITSSTDKAISAAQSLVSNIPVPIPGISAGVNSLLSAASFVHGAKRDAQNRNTAAFATTEDDRLSRSASLALRSEIVGSISSKIYDIYSVEVDGKSPLSALNESGRDKFVSAFVGQVMGNIGNFQNPSRDDLPRIDDQKFRSDAAYREGLSERFGIEVDSRKLSDQNYFNKIATKLETAMFVDFVADRLVDQTLHGKDALEFLGKTHFNTSDLVEKDRVQNLTAEGLIRRVGIVSSSGAVFLSEDRQKDLAAGEAKYGYRLATAEEEKAIESGKGIEGYAVADVESLKQQASKILKPTDFKTPINEEKISEEKIGEALDDLIADYRGRKAENPGLSHKDFLKSSAINSGEKSEFSILGGRQRDESRQHFNDNLLDPLSKLLAAVDADVSRPKVDIPQQTSSSKKDQKPAKEERGEGEAKKEAKPFSISNSLQTLSKAFGMLRDQVSSHAKSFDQRLEDSAKSQTELQSKLDKAKEELDQKSQKPPFFKRVMSAVTFGFYKGGLMQDTTQDQENVKKLEEAKSKGAKGHEDLQSRAQDVRNVGSEISEKIANETPRREGGVNLTGLTVDTKRVIDVVEVDSRVAKAKSEKDASNQLREGILDRASSEAEKAFKIADIASRDKDVTLAADTTDKVIGVVGTVVSALAIPGASLAASIAGVANDAKKRFQAGQLADNANAGKEIIKNIATKVFESYSVKVDGKSPLDALSEKGQAKFITNIVEKALKEIGKDPSLKKGGGFDLEEVSSRVLSSILHPQKSTMSMISMNTHFKDDEVAPGRQNEAITVEGLIQRVGIVTKGGERFLSADRAKDLKSGESKYGYRLATPEEEAALEKGKGISGYKRIEVQAKAQAEEQQKIAPKILRSQSDSDLYASIQDSRRSSQDLRRLKEFEDVDVRGHVIDSIKTTERTDAISATKAAILDGAGIGGLMSSPQKKDGQEKPQSSADKAIVECAERQDALAQMIHPQHLKNGGDNAKDALSNFISGYHAQAIGGATKEELINFAKQEMPFKDNDLLIKMTVDLAVETSEAKLLKSESQKAAAEMMAKTIADVATHLSKKDENVLHEVEEVLKRTSLQEATTKPREAVSRDFLERFSSKTGPSNGGRGG